MIHLEYSPRYVQQCRAETEKYLVRSEQLLFQGGYEYKCGGDTHINSGGILYAYNRGGDMNIIIL